jgi:hypothetical protein
VVIRLLGRVADAVYELELPAAALVEADPG